MTNKYFEGDNFEQIYLSILNEINQHPEYVGTARDIGFKEIVNLSFELTNPYDRLVWNSSRRANYEFAMKFFIWMLNGSDDYEFVKGVNPNAVNYIDKTKTEDPKQAKFSTAYGPRIV